MSRSLRVAKVFVSHPFDVVGSQAIYDKTNGIGYIDLVVVFHYAVLDIDYAVCYIFTPIAHMFAQLYDDIDYMQYYHRLSCAYVAVNTRFPTFSGNPAKFKCIYNISIYF